MAPYTLPSNAVWFITGCSTGIGHALCTHLATKTTSRVVATARKPSTLDSLPSGPNILKLPLDVTSETSIESALSTALSTFGRIDVLVNNAGFGHMSDSEATALSDARAIMETNFWGAARMARLALPIFRDRTPQTGPAGGLVIQVSSMGGRVAFPSGSFYHASKFALEGFTESLAQEMHPDWNIHFLCVEPGGVKTQYFDSTAKKRNAAEKGRHPAYSDPNMPTNRLIAHFSKPDAMETFAEPEKLAEVLVGVVEKGGELGLRLPLGADSWASLMQAAKSNLERLEMVKDLSESVSGTKADADWLHL